MSYTITEELQLVLYNIIDGLTKDIARAQGLSCDFVISVTPLLEANYAIIAGYPPTLVVNSTYIMNLVMSNDEKIRRKSKRQLRQVLASALAKIPRMERTLSNSPIAEAIAMLEGMNKWAKTHSPDKLIFSIPDQHIKTEEVYTITLTEINSGISVSMSGDNPTKLRAMCREKLTKMVATNEALLQKMEDDTVKMPEPTYVEVKINPNTQAEEAKYSFDEPPKLENKE